jgi:hypothetical protein
VAKENEHGKILARAASAALSLLGCRRKGRSRLWFADQKSWVIVIEFQPSGFAKGSYLNVAPHWLWHENNSWSFDYGDVRAANFIEFEDSEQFERAADALAARAAQEVIRFRKLLNSASEIVKCLTDAADDGSIWQCYHAAVANGLVGNTSSSLNLFARILKFQRDSDWIPKVQNECAELAGKLQDGCAFREAVRSIINRSRALHHLPEISDCLAEW